MKRLTIFLFGSVLLVIATGLAIIGAKIFDISRNFSVNSVIFQPADLSRDRIEKPLPLHVLSDDFIRDNLIKKFVYEYFYIVPDADDIKRRRMPHSTLAEMSSESVFDQWNKDFAKDMERQANENVIRRVFVRNIVLPPSSEYFQITYDLLTWNIANDITAAPQIQKNKTMSIRLNFEKMVKQKQANGINFDVKKYLSDGADPATILRFRVLEVIVK